MDSKTPPPLIGLLPSSGAYNPSLHYSQNPTGSVVYTSSYQAIARCYGRLRSQIVIDRQRHFMSNAALTEGLAKQATLLQDRLTGSPSSPSPTDFSNQRPAKLSVWLSEKGILLLQISFRRYTRTKLLLGAWTNGRPALARSYAQIEWI